MLERRERRVPSLGGTSEALASKARACCTVHWQASAAERPVGRPIIRGGTFVGTARWGQTNAK